MRVPILLLLSLFLSTLLNAQISRITIPAGTPEDKALQTISAEQDAAKRIEMLDQFVKDFAANKDAVAYANWQLAQAYQGTGENEKALAYGEKAFASAPGNIEILVSLVGIADAVKDYQKAVEYAAQGGTAYNSVASQPKPADVTPEEWATRITQEQSSFTQSYEYLEVAAYNAISAEPNAKARMEMIERFTPAFPKTRFEEAIQQLALASLQELNDRPRAVAFGEKALQQNPDSVPTLLMLANTYIEDTKTLDKAITYATKAVKLAKVDDGKPGTKLAAGMAHSTLGYALLRQDKAVASIPEFKQAIDMLGDNESVRAEALYRLGWAYGRLGRRAEAKPVLEKCIAIDGPYRPLAKELLQKVNAPAPKR